jgi:glycosyltransferase involved in cell wall biosynthesis
VTALVLFASHAGDPLERMTGIGRYLVELASALPAACPAGWSVDVVSPLDEMGERGRRPAWLPGPVGFRGVGVPRRLLRAVWSAAPGPRLERLAGGFDLLHALHSASPVPTGRPAVMTVHDLAPVLHPEWYGRAVSFGARRALERAVAGGWQIITDSQFVAAQVVERAGADPRRVRAVPLGVGELWRRGVSAGEKDRACARWGLTRDRYVVAVGNISVRKNLPTVLRAVARLPEATLVLAGRDHSDRLRVAAEIERLGVAGRVRRLGFVPDADLPPLVAAARGLVHPSVDEGFGLPPLEAMAVGTPALVADAGSLPEIVGGAGVRLPPLDADAWAGALERLWADDAHCAHLAERGRERAAGFTWARTAAATVAVYREALGAD